MLARLGRAFLIAALLLSQQAALAHDLWHAAGSASTQAPKAPGGKANKLCDLHDLLGTVLGAVGGTVQLAAFLDLADTRYTSIASAVREAPRLTPHSRDPPFVS